MLDKKKKTFVGAKNRVQTMLLVKMHKKIEKKKNAYEDSPKMKKCAKKRKKSLDKRKMKCYNRRASPNERV